MPLKEFFFYPRLHFLFEITVWRFIIVAVLIFGTSVSGISQVTLNVKNKPIRQVIKTIEKSTEYKFFYNDDFSALNKTVTVQVTNVSIDAVLKMIFDKSGISWEKKGKNLIVLTPSKTAEIVVPVQGNNVGGKRIAGIVMDAATGESLPGVNIIIEGSKTGVISDVDGKFAIDVPSEASNLVFSFLGYIKTKENINKSGFLKIALEPDVKKLEEVVVIGYGKVKKNDATGSVLAIKPDQFNKGSQVTAQDALLGKMAGVNVIPGSGSPGDGATIRIRSGSSLSASNDPLIVIDGVPVDNSDISGSTNILGSINPNDIETFTVLKDASSTAIYGSRASNGVIIITTKKGAKGMTMKFNYNNNFTVSEVPNTLNVLNGDEFRSYIKSLYSSTSVQVTGLGTENTNWQNEIYHTSFGQEHNFSVNGNLKSTPYRFSFGYTNQNGIIRTNNYERYTTGITINPHFLQDHLSLNMNVKGSYERNRSIESTVIPESLSFDPTRPVHASSNYGLGYYTWLSSGGVPLTIADSNPVADINLCDNTSKIKRSIGNVAFDYKVHGFENLRFNLNLGYDFLKSDGKELIPDNAPFTYVNNKKDGEGLNRTYIQKKQNELLDFYSNYNKDFGIHHLDIMAGYGWQHFWKNYTDDRLNNQGAVLFTPTHYESEYYLVSFYGRINYNIASKYLFTGTIRSDASSRFSKENRWGYFPSGAFAWRVNQENFLKDCHILSDLKLRLSYGQTGQQDIGSDYPYQSTYTASYNNARYLFGNTWYTTYRADGYDPNIKWETTTTYNMGVDFGILNGRISGSIDVYRRNTKDLLNKIPTAAGSNLASEIYTNIGSMKNNGIEFALNTTPINTKNWIWEANFNFTHSKSIITKLNTIDSDNYGVLVGAISSTGKTAQIQAVGYEPYTFYLAKQAYDANGLPIEGSYVQADGSVSKSDSYKVKSKSAMPTSYIGFSTKLTYKNWDLGFNSHGSFGNYIYNYVAANDYKGKVYESNTYSNILKRTQVKGFSVQQLYSDYFLENGSFFRMDNLTLGYTISKLGNSKMTLRITGAIQNVFVITNYSGLDPEISSGIDRNLYPRPRIYMMGANLNF